MAGIHNYTVQEAQNASLGQAGSLFIDDDVQHTGSFTAITALDDSTLNVSGTTRSSDTLTDAVNFIIPAGVTIYGKFTAVQFAAGCKVIAYRG